MQFQVPKFRQLDCRATFLAQPPGLLASRIDILVYQRLFEVKWRSIQSSQSRGKMLRGRSLTESGLLVLWARHDPPGWLYHYLAWRSLLPCSAPEHTRFFITWFRNKTLGIAFRFMPSSSSTLDLPAANFISLSMEYGFCLLVKSNLTRNAD
jgi:hypothetical protein